MIYHRKFKEYSANNSNFDTMRYFKKNNLAIDWNVGSLKTILNVFHHIPIFKLSGDSYERSLSIELLNDIYYNYEYPMWVKEIAGNNMEALGFRPDNFYWYAICAFLVFACRALSISITLYIYINKKFNHTIFIGNDKAHISILLTDETFYILKAVNNSINTTSSHIDEKLIQKKSYKMEKNKIMMKMINLILKKSKLIKKTITIFI